MPTCLIGLGANLGDRRETLQRAVELLARHSEISVPCVSRWRETRPVGGPADQPAYLNGAATLETTLAPLALLAVLQSVEKQLGRQRRQRWDARPIDLDLLLYGDRVIQSPTLVVPHPRMAWRRFVLEPAAEIAPVMVHPVLGRSIADLLNHLDATPPYVAITGAIRRENSFFVRRVAEAASADALFDPAPFDPGVMPILGATSALAARAPARGAIDFRLAVALESLRRRARRLDVDDPRWSRPERYAISDFWFEQSAAAASAWLGTQGQSCYRRLWRRLESRIVRPRLIVVLEVPRERLAGRDQPPRTVCRQWRETLSRQLRRANLGPVLQIDNSRSPDALEEVIAAICAMGP
ncbi:MAG: 2-amino-4-hydroxy-6-hydroxymethyldihydropteridine diphosphokinase [Pirellulales bacterium]|nr:2-amino-4-hydroxy-6-hydroxymethyldihydropteridine diphosphokinase [Pirellulales bacterium]